MNKKNFYTILFLFLFFIILSLSVYFIPNITKYDLYFLGKIQETFSFISPKTAFFISEFFYQNLWKFLLIIVTSIVLLKNYDFLLEIMFLISVKYGIFLKDFIKNLIARPRPPIEYQALIHHQTYSFPSGHSFNNTVLLGLTIYFIYKFINNKYLKNFLQICCVCWIFLVMLSRLILGVHYTTDVLGGFILGLIIVFSIILIDNILPKTFYINLIKKFFTKKKNV